MNQPYDIFSFIESIHSCDIRYLPHHRHQSDPFSSSSSTRAAETSRTNHVAICSPFATNKQALNPADDSLMGVIICKLEQHTSHSPSTYRGYIAMLAVSSAWRGRGIATALVRRAVDAMAARRADEVVLETEETNLPAMRLYERLGFLRSKKLHRYYLNGNSAYRLVLLLRSPEDQYQDPGREQEQEKEQRRLKEALDGNEGVGVFD